MRTRFFALFLACASCGGDDNAVLFGPAPGSDAAVDAANDGTAPQEASTPEASTSDAEENPTDAAHPPDAGVDAPLDVGNSDVSPSCSDGVLNQGESGIDCGGPCPPCVGFRHEETFDHYQQWAPEEEYTVEGSCFDSTMVDGWALGVAPDSEFPMASGYFPVIDTRSTNYLFDDCDDYLLTPMLNTNQATSVTIAFDSRLYVTSFAMVEIRVELDGVTYSAWSATDSLPSQRITLGPYAIDNANALRVLFRYVGSLDGFWAIDNVVIEGQ